MINELDEEKFSKSNDNPKLIKQLYENALNLKSLAHLYKGKIYTFYNNYSFAIKEFNKSLDLNPKNIRTYNFYKTNILLKNLYPKERKLYENKIKYLNTGLDNLALSLTKIDFLKKPFLFFDNIEISNPLLSFVNYIENYLVDDKQPFFNKYYYNFIYLTYHYLNKPEKSYNVLENIYNTDNQLKIFSFMDFYYYIQSSIKIAQPIVEIKKIISLAIKNAKEIEFIVLEPIEEYFKQLILELDCKNLDGLFVKSEIYPFYNEFQWSHNLSCLKVVLNDLQNVHKKNDIFNITYNKDFFKEAKDKDNEQFKNKFLNDFIYYALNTELEDTNINEVITVDEDNKSTLNNETFKLLFSKTMIKLKNIYGNEFEKIFNILDEDTKDDFKMLKWHHNKIFKYSEYISNKIEKGMDLKGILSILFFHYGNNNITSDNWVELNLYTYYLFILKRKNVKPNRIIELLKNKLFPIGVDAFLGIIVGIQSIYTVSVSISFFLINHINEKEELKKEEQSTPLSFSEFLDLDYLKNNIIIKENINLLKLNAKKMIKA